MYNITTSKELVKTAEFMTALRYGNKFDSDSVYRLVSFVEPTVKDFDQYVDEIWEFTYTVEDGRFIKVWVQHLRHDDSFMTFSSIENGKYVPYFNKSLEVNLEFVEIFKSFEK